MSFAVLAGRVEGVSIDDPAVVSKSWPGFWSARDAMRATGS
jgi:5-enolpyruvylshikimate-3-phosphate synthase